MRSLQRGFTLADLVAALAFLTVTALCGFPVLTRVAAGLRLTLAAFELAALVAAAAGLAAAGSTGAAHASGALAALAAARSCASGNLSPATVTSGGCARMSGIPLPFTTANCRPDRGEAMPAIVLIGAQ